MTSSEPREPLSAEEVERRRRAAELLGELLPGRATDESDEGWGERGGSSREDDLRRDVPPHHGG